MLPCSKVKKLKSIENFNVAHYNTALLNQPANRALLSRFLVVRICAFAIQKSPVKNWGFNATL
jgi:hypothetical protein